ncbi:hypothetical protein HUG10_01545 [Halorarum halophilum]|uniref:Uncharacterized protein n=1 Tax=Halorarum halophilum TaxID=2743090 RepID=A0A7D5KKP5_9EURY|nr:hypothetical protein [Halobaculum halophilum]QLG26302.1 hypothetical protein HUG10_01545 [Halobaculum halophilum]
MVGPPVDESMVTLRRDDRVDLADVATATTLRDRLRELPVDGIVPDGWRAGTEVVSFPNEPPADAATVSHPAHDRELLVTTAGTDGSGLAVYERDRQLGRRLAVASVPGREDDAEAVCAGLEAAARHAARIESGAPGEPTVETRDSAATLGAVVDGIRRRFEFY